MGRSHTLVRCHRTRTSSSEMCLWVLIPKRSGRKWWRTLEPKNRRTTFLLRKPQAPTCSPWTEEKSVRGSERDTAGLSLPSFRPDVPHQWMEAVLHISSTRSMVLSLQRQGQDRLFLQALNMMSQQNQQSYLQLVILQMMSKGSSRLTVSGITSKDNLMSPYPGACARKQSDEKRIKKALIWWLIPFFAADWSEASPSPRDWSSRQCPACRSPSRPWWLRPSQRTPASASGSTDTAGCPWAAGRTFSQRCTLCKRNIEWRRGRVEALLWAARLWRRCAAFTLRLWRWLCWALWRCTSWTAPEKLSPWTWARWWCSGSEPLGRLRLSGEDAKLNPNLLPRRRQETLRRTEQGYQFG